jgi:hypothetical protein
MTQGCLLFAHNGTLDYGSQAVLAAKLAIKHLKVPVSLVTDQSTLDSINSKFDGPLPFDQIILVDRPLATNFRKLKGIDGLVEFNNGNRSSAWDLTPYDRTLVIDTDFLIFSDRLNQYWDSSYDFLITPGMLELQEELVSAKEHKLSDTTINLLWATNIMFTKCPETKLIFDLVNYIRQEYQYYANLYDFYGGQFRNDFAFSIACHILSGHGGDPIYGELPVPLFFIDSDNILDVKENGQINFLIQTRRLEPLLVRTLDQDVHIMNKQSILDNLEKFMRLA